MIIQGTNSPIIFVFSDINDIPETDVSVSLYNEIRELKHWAMSDLEVSEDGMRYDAPITQTESMGFDIGPCHILFKWLDDSGNARFVLARDDIVEWRDTTLLEEA